MPDEYAGLQEILERRGWSRLAAEVLISLCLVESMDVQDAYRLARRIEEQDKDDGTAK